VTTAATLRATRTLLTPPGAWLPVSFSARTAEGRIVQARHPDAARWGILAALVAVTGPKEDRRAEVDAIRAVVGKPAYLCDWEAADGRSQAEVLDALDRAAAEADDPYGYGRAA
jgi:hypothetical protein